MVSRYDVMKQSATQVDSDNQPWPDPLSVDFSSFTYSQPPFIYEPDDTFQQRPYVTCFGLYQQAAYDDIILNINNVPHTSQLFTFLTINLPVLPDVVGFIKSNS